MPGRCGLKFFPRWRGRTLPYTPFLYTFFNLCFYGQKNWCRFLYLCFLDFKYLHALFVYIAQNFSKKGVWNLWLKIFLDNMQESVSLLVYNVYNYIFRYLVIQAMYNPFQKFCWELFPGPAIWENVPSVTVHWSSYVWRQWPPCWRRKLKLSI